MAVFSLKRLVVVAVSGAILFLASFVASGKMNASELFYCGFGEVGILDPVTGAQQFDPITGEALCAPAGGQPAAGGELMTASYYGWGHAGSPTASGEPFDPTGYTAAHKTMPFGTQLLVSHGGSSTVVTVNDRGPFVDGRDLDLSQAAAETIGLTGPGVAPVEVTVL